MKTVARVEARDLVQVLLRSFDADVSKDEIGTVPKRGLACGLYAAIGDGVNESSIRRLAFWRGEFLRAGTAQKQFSRPVKSRSDIERLDPRSSGPEP